MTGQKTDQSSAVRQAGHIAVQIQSIEAFDFQRHVTLQQFVNVGHDRMFHTTTNLPCQCSSV